MNSNYSPKGKRPFTSRLITAPLITSRHPSADPHLCRYLKNHTTTYCLITPIDTDPLTLTDEAPYGSHADLLGVQHETRPDPPKDLIPNRSLHSESIFMF
ncbi:MAG: hypothetical protein BA869_01905 [Desulfuromonadales bacterium C00003107]|nr:MAG: hypothetical protein BA869_01905 [Desulfuromonadales bacterium C00003107]